MRPVVLILSLCLLGSVLVPMGASAAKPAPPPAAKAADPTPTATTPAEAELGKQTAEAIEKSYKLIDDKKTIEKLTAMANAIAPFTERPDVKYTCKILNVGDINAMAIPGGTIYVTNGLLKAVESDHELAAVLAHEVAHNALYHSRDLMKRESSMSLVELLVILSTLYASRDNEVSPGQMIIMSELVKQALLNGYTVQLEAQADRHAVEYLHKSKLYDPVGLYSVIKGFEQIDRVQDSPSFTKDHPFPEERKRLMEEQFKTLGIKINLWPVVNFHMEVIPPAQDAPGYLLQLRRTPVMTYLAADGAATAQQRAEAAMKTVNRILERTYIDQYDIDVDNQGDTAIVRMRAFPVITIKQVDAEAAGMTLDALSAQTMQRIKNAIRDENIRRS